VAAAALAVCASVLSFLARTRDAGGLVVGYRIALLLMAGVVGFTGHLGGQMAWGADFLFEPLHQREQVPVAVERVQPPAEIGVAGTGGADTGVADTGATETASAGADNVEAAGGGAESVPSASLTTGAAQVPDVTQQVSYTRDVAPIVSKHCFECHGPTGKAKADLRLHDLTLANADFYSTEFAALVLPGDAQASALFAVAALPRDHELAMPPDGDGLSAPELDVLRRWIDGGTDLEAMLAAASTSGGGDAAASGAALAPTADDTSIPASVPASSGAADLTDDPYAAFVPVSDALLEAARTSGARIAPLAATTAALEVSFRFQPATSDAELAAIVPLAANVVVLDLARTAVTDAALADVARLGELRRVHLEGTAVGDTNLGLLGALPHLEYLNLTQTKVSDAGLAALETLPAGCRVYLWGSGASDEARAALAARRPDLVLP
jgi:mono/diheme cytochrome c family protein